jgi:hypothetical protein
MTAERCRLAALKSLYGAMVLLLVTGCASEYIVLHSVTGEPLIISRRAASAPACITKIKRDGSELGVTFRYIHMRGTLFGRSLLWPFEQGYACEAAIGPEQRPSGTYPIEAYFTPQGS